MTASRTSAIAAMLGGATRRAAGRRARELLDLLGLRDRSTRCRRACRAVSASAWRSPGRWPTRRRCCWPTSRPARSTPTAAPTCCGCSPASTTAGQTIVLVTHDPVIAAAAQRVGGDARRPDVVDEPRRCRRRDAGMSAWWACAPRGAAHGGAAAAAGRVLAVGGGVVLSAFIGARRDATVDRADDGARRPAPPRALLPNDPAFDWAPVAELPGVRTLQRFAVIVLRRRRPSRREHRLPPRRPGHAASRWRASCCSPGGCRTRAAPTRSPSAPALPTPAPVSTSATS